MPSLFPGMKRWPEKRYSDMRDSTKSDPERTRQLELDWYMERYDRWHSLYDGSALEETIPTLEDSETDSPQDTYKWPVRFNLIKSYCRLYAGMLWGRARTGHEANDLFDIRIDPRSPSGQNAKAVAGQLQDNLTYFWSFFFHKLRPCAVIQQWAGGCILKAAWDPYSPTAIMGIKLETIQPQHFYPIWNPVNTDELIAVRVKFGVSKEVAREVYGLTKEEADEYASGNSIRVEEHWDRHRYYVRLGKGHKGDEDGGIVGKTRAGPGGEWAPLEGENPYRHPMGYGIIPYVYIPRLASGGFFGESLAHDLEGVQEELNKTLADYGDALVRGAHPAFGISDFNGPDRREKVIKIPRHGALNMGRTPASAKFAPKIHEFPAPKVPEQTTEFTDRLLSLSEMGAGLTPAARGASGVGSGVARALEMLPTTNLIDWQRSHWTQGLTGKGGLNEIISTIWWNKGALLLGFPQLNPVAIMLKQSVEYRPVVPRERTEVIDEVVRLTTADAISPWEAIRRLGDVEDIDSEVARLAYWIGYVASIEAAVAGRPIQIARPTNMETPAGSLPDVAGMTDQPKPKPAPTEPEGLSQRSKENG